jgi:hypothetical protein
LKLDRYSRKHLEHVRLFYTALCASILGYKQFYYEMCNAEGRKWLLPTSGILFNLVIEKRIDWRQPTDSKQSLWHEKGWK